MYLKGASVGAIIGGVLEIVVELSMFWAGFTVFRCVTSNNVNVFTTFQFNRCMNCCLGKESNFRKSNRINSFGTPYDYGSIMHYRANAFSKNGQPTIIPKKAGVTIGNRRALSPIDVQQMMLLYKCKGSSTVPPPTTTPPAPGTFRCNFNNGMCGFTQDKDDQFDWTRKKGQTSSSSTGPVGDHTGGGYYVYIETSSPRRLGDKAIISRLVSLTGKSCLSFFYHMRGSDMGTLRVKLCDAVIFEKSGNQGSVWLKQELRLQGSGTRKLIFEGIRGRSFRGDAAIDDVMIYDC